MPPSQPFIHGCLRVKGRRGKHAIASNKTDHRFGVNAWSVQVKQTMYLGGIDGLFGVNRPSVSLLFLHIFIYKNKIDHMKLMTKRDLEQRLELTKLRYERQEIRLYVLLQSMQNNRDNIKQIEYALLVMERVSTQRRRHIPGRRFLNYNSVLSYFKRERGR